MVNVRQAQLVDERQARLGVVALQVPLALRRHRRRVVAVGKQQQRLDARVCTFSSIDKIIVTVILLPYR